jgi:putative transposase
VAVRQAELGVPVAEICRRLRDTEVTFYRWKKRFAGMGVTESRELKSLVADLTMDKQMLQKVIAKKL